MPSLSRLAHRETATTATPGAPRPNAVSAAEIGLHDFQEQPPNKPPKKRCRCRASGKLMFYTWLEAIGALAERPDREGHVFRCPKCRAWHLSTHPQRDRYKAIRYRKNRGEKARLASKGLRVAF